MRFQQSSISKIALAAVATAVLFLLAVMPAAQAAISWDGEGGSQWWFNPANWSEDEAILLPPMQMSDTDNDPETPDVLVSADALINKLPAENPIADFNDDGKVSAADFTVWRDNLGAPTLPNRDQGNTGVIGTNDFEDWVDNYGSGGTNWDQGEGVVYDPANDPYFDDTDLDPDTEGMQTAADLDYLNGYGPQKIHDLYVGRNTPVDALLTIKGDLEIAPNSGNNGFILGRSSATSTVITGRAVQLSGFVSMTGTKLDLGGTDTSTSAPVPVVRHANATYDYRGGVLQVSTTAGAGIRLSTGSGTTVAGYGEVGTSGIGTFIMHNPTTPGRVETQAFLVAADGRASANGVDRGVGIVEFHFENGGVRPIQVRQNLVLANGADADGTGTRSARLRLVLDEAPCTGESCVPMDLGLFDIDSDDVGGGVVIYPGANDSSLGTTFSNADAVDPLAASAVYDSDADDVDLVGDSNVVSAIFGGIQYNWTISYLGNITWTNQANSVVDEIQDNSECTDVSCVDVVLLGLSSVALGSGSGSVGTVPEPSSLMLLAASAIGLLAARRRGC